jgi:radical SAM protein with 4Fe4S-binding SPASM domain
MTDPRATEEAPRCFDPRYKLRRAKSNVLCFAFDPLRIDISTQRVLHPLDAMLLCLFDGRRPRREIAQIIVSAGQVPEQDAYSFIQRFEVQYSEFLSVGTTDRKLSPSDFAMPASQIDMNHFRLLSPLTLALLPTFRCSSNCEYCYANRRSPQDAHPMNLALAKRIVDQAWECNVELIYLGGGDPFTNDWTCDLIAHIISKGMKASVSTKECLSLCSAQKLADAGLESIQLSLDSVDDSTADQLTGRRGYVADFFRTLRNCRQARIDVTTNSVVTGKNFRGIPDMVKTLLEHGLKSITLSRYYRSTFHHHDSLFVDDEDVRWLNQQLDCIETPKGAVVSRVSTSDRDRPSDRRWSDFLNRACCAFGRSGLVVTPSAKVVPCEQLPTIPPYVLGDLRVTSLQEVWDSDALCSLLHLPRESYRGHACYECEHFDLCIHQRGHCLRDAYKVNGTLNAVHPRCPRFPADVRLT